MGEHLDYNGLPVLPMTLAQEVRLAFTPRQDAKVNLHNLDNAFHPADFENATEIKMSAEGAWENYAKAVLQGVNRNFEIAEFKGMDVLVESTLPHGAGLSSSTALSVALGLAYLSVLDVSLDEDSSRLDFAAVLAKAEQYVGTQGGGMDQAIILNGGEGQVSKINFFPLRLESLPMPGGYRFVVSHTGVMADKSGACRDAYNAGPRYSRLICALVKKHLQQEFGEDFMLPNLGELWFGPLCLTYDETRLYCEAAVPDEFMHLNTVAMMLELSPEQVIENYLGDGAVPEEGFPLQARMRHILSEYKRVEMARDALLSEDMVLFGRLMYDSHASCARDFAISCRELDELVSAADSGGALGARLTGAGFGGSVISLVAQQDVEDFILHLQETYYAEERFEGLVPVVFTAEASVAAGYC